MERGDFDYRLGQLLDEQEQLLVRMNQKAAGGNGIVDRYVNPVVTADHSPIFWRYDLNYETNPHFLERLGINAAFNCGAMEFEQQDRSCGSRGRCRPKVVFRDR